MNNLICISTGAVYKFSEDMNEKIKMLRGFSPVGIEICFADSQHLIDFKISEENLSYLKSLKWVSIHAPWLGVRYGRNRRTDEVVKSMRYLSDLINAKNVVFHGNFADDFSFFKNCDFVYSIENSDWRYFFHTVSEMKELFANNDDYKFTFDFAHALTVDPLDAHIYIEKFKDRLIQIHFSYLSRELSDHWFLHKHDNKEMQELLECLKPLSVPIVLECVATDESELSLIKKEMEYAREIFG
jgi:hypothetical protein